MSMSERDLALFIVNQDALKDIHAVLAWNALLSLTQVSVSRRFVIVSSSADPEANQWCKQYLSTPHAFEVQEEVAFDTTGACRLNSPGFQRDNVRFVDRERGSLADALRVVMRHRHDRLLLFLSAHALVDGKIQMGPDVFLVSHLH